VSVVTISTLRCREFSDRVEAITTALEVSVPSLQHGGKLDVRELEELIVHLQHSLLHQ